MANPLYGRDIISISELTRPEIELVLDTAKRLKEHPDHTLLKDRVIASCFFEASTRTRLSFETSIHRLGGQVIGFSDASNTSMSKKGEPFADLAKSFSADSHAKDGGLWKNVKPEEAFRPEIAAAIDKLVVGETSPLLNLDGWGFIVKKIGQTKERKRSFAEAYEEIEANVKKDLAAAKYKEWIDRLRAEAFIKIYPPPSEK